MKNLLITLFVSIVSTISYGQFHDKGYGDFIIGKTIKELPFDFEVDEIGSGIGFGVDDIEVFISFEDGIMTAVITEHKNTRLAGIDEPVINKSLDELKSILGNKCQQGVYDGKDVLFFYPTPQSKSNKSSVCMLIFENDICINVETTLLK